MDQHKLRASVFEKTGIKIDTTDPVFALVALNESVLEEILQRHWAQIREHTSGQYGAAGAGMPAPTGTRQPAFKAGSDNFEADEELPRPIPDADGQTGTESGAPAMQANPSSGASANHQGTWHPPLLWLALAIPLLTTLLVLGGQAWLLPEKAPAQLSGEQKTRLLRAEKLEKAIEKLDSRSKAQLQAELDKL